MTCYLLVLLAFACVSCWASDNVTAYSGNPIDTCPKLARGAPPVDVKYLKPVDIRALGAMGDSFTAGFAMHGLPIESRDEVYITGDKAGATTITNFFKHYGDTIAVHNVAVSGDVVQGMDKQARRLIAAMKSDRSIDFEQDWKMVTILIGGNNQCASCFGQAANQPTQYIKDLTSALVILKQEMPRALVNLVSMVNLSSLETAPGVDEHCRLQHLVGKSECPCPFLGANASVAVQRVIEEDNSNLYNIAKGFATLDFAVVVQPGMDMMSVPDWTYLSRFDCFHPALVTHQQVALALWTNIFQPVGKKTHEFQLPVNRYCPTDSDIIHSAMDVETYVV